jgi:hypothetical protein
MDAKRTDPFRGSSHGGQQRPPGAVPAAAEQPEEAEEQHRDPVQDLAGPHEGRRVQDQPDGVGAERDEEDGLPEERHPLLQERALLLAVARAGGGGGRDDP